VATVFRYVLGDEGNLVSVVGPEGLECEVTTWEKGGNELVRDVSHGAEPNAKRKN
jgi:hypothetical protein